MSKRRDAENLAFRSDGCEPNDAVLSAPLLSVVTPTFNERRTIEARVRGVLDALDGLAVEVIVVDDDSPDGAWATVDALMSQDPRVRLLRRVGRRGLSSAALEGALAARGRYVAVLDAAKQHDERLLPLLLSRLRNDDCDIVVATRYSRVAAADPGAGTGGASPPRTFWNKAANFAVKALTRGRLKDPMSGLFALSREAVHAAAPRIQVDGGFTILFDLVMALPEARVAEEPFLMRAQTQSPNTVDFPAAWRFACAVASHATKLPARFLSFGLVGGAGLAAHLIILGALHRGLTIDFPPAQALAIWGAATTNFVLNTLLTYADRRPRGLGVVAALMLFYLSCALAAVANLLIANGLFDWGAPWWAAATAGAVAGGVWNFLASDRLVWRK